MTLPAHLGLYILAAACIAALGLIVFGIVRLAATGRVLKARIDAYEELPVLKVLEITEARLTLVRLRAAGIPRLQTRAQAAADEIDLALERVRAIVRIVRFAVRSVLT